MSAIAVSKVTRRFGDLTALRDVDIDVPVGAVSGLLGHNGAGKTTLLRVLTGLLRADTGRVEVLGHEPTSEGRLLRRRIGVLGETPGLDQLLTVRENLATAAALHGMTGDAAAGRIDDVLVELGLDEHADRRVRGLSAGLRQRVALARAIAHTPELLLLDEPTTNMDPVAARGVRELMRRWAHDHGRTVVVCTHDLREAAISCDQVIILEHGRVLAAGSPADLAVRVRAREGVTVTVGAADAARARAVLIGSGHRPRSVGAAIHLDDLPPEDVPALVAQLVTAGIGIHAVIPTAPSLEDAYVALHRGEVPA